MGRKRKSDGKEKPLESGANEPRAAKSASGGASGGGSTSGNGGNLGFEAKLWAAADKMRGHMDAGEYKHVALGLIFLKYISGQHWQAVHDAAEEGAACRRRGPRRIHG